MSWHKKLRTVEVENP